MSNLLALTMALLMLLQLPGRPAGPAREVPGQAAGGQPGQVAVTGAAPVPDPAVSANVKVGISKIPYVMSDRQGAWLGTITLVEEEGFTDAFVNGDEFEVVLPPGVEFAEATRVITGQANAVHWSLVGKSTLRLCFTDMAPDRRDTVAIQVVANLKNYRGEIKANIKGKDSAVPSGQWVIGVAR
ncbi:hypothetical protein [Desulforamulus hydrothermalis]|uniref:hypothetical protein n=1 Tax=Desulforamulus hydrothermalis TaxID=412895 RepID=UPI000921BCF8|nr:hypothetical protein [Desulforamulus hydrothermalis]SHH19391.1 hypothetical protein SAMN02745177_01766 [Desulforamulus hydrothermalis Lam5 = DSM 18033]